MASVGPKKIVLPIPNNVAQAPNAFELFSVWYVDDVLYVTVKAGAWKDPAAYGIMIADLIRHIAHTCWKVEGRDKQEALTRILEGFQAGIEFPTDEPAGKLIIEP